MRRRFGQALRLGVSSAALALVKTSRWHGEPLTPLAGCDYGAASPGGHYPGPDLEALARALRQLLADAAPGRWPLTIVLSDELARMWQVTPPPASARMADLEAACALRFQCLYGEPASDWAMSASWSATRPFLAAGVPRALLAVLGQAARDQRLCIVEIVPQFVAALNRHRGALARGAWFGQVHDGVLTVGAVKAGAGLAAVRAQALPADAGRDWLGRHIAREALLLNLAPPERLQLCGPAPAAWSGAPEGAGPACSMLEAARERPWPAMVQLAASGSRA